MDNNKRNYIQEQENIKVALGELSFLMGWIMQRPYMAGQLAIEAHEMSRRYVEEVTPDVDFRTIIPIAVWKSFQAACISEESTNLSEQSCYDKLQDMLFRVMQDLIMQYQDLGK